MEQEGFWRYLCESNMYLIKMRVTENSANSPFMTVIYGTVKKMNERTD